MSEDRTIHVGEGVPDGEPFEFPTIDILTGRGFTTGKSGSGKSNTVSVVVEELLEHQFPVMIVDVEGEYYGLKEEYELLHAGADEECDIQVSPEHAEKLANLALEQNVPIILDISGYLDEDAADDLILETVRHLFTKQKKLKKPFLLVVEECHEYLPEGGGMDETGKMLIKVAKRGRKHGLGIVGISQRPADVKKDFITQANWLVWHRLTWENDTKVVGRIVGSEYGEKISDLDAGEAFVQLDWTDEEVERVQFKRKRTFDAGATPGLDDFERPELKSVSDALVDDLSEITEQQQEEQDRIAELEAELGQKEKRIRDLEQELENAQNVSKAAKQMANALSGNSYQATFGGDREAELARLQERIDDLEARLHERSDAPGGAQADASDGDRAAASAENRAAGSGGDASAEDRAAGSGGDTAGEAADGPSAGAGGDPAGAAADDHSPETAEADGGGAATDADTTDEEAAPFDWQSEADVPDDRVEAELDRLRRKGEQLHRAEAAAASGRAADAPDTPAPEDLMEYLHAVPVVTRINGARRDSLCNDAHAWRIVAALATTQPATVHDLAGHVDRPVEQVQSLLAELRARDLVTRDDDRRYTFDLDHLDHLVTHAEERDALGELREQWQL